MANYRKYGKGKKYYKNRKFKFTKSKLYKYRSSKNQANQIYKLNKKVNLIEKKTAPEIQRIQDNIYDTVFVTNNEPMTNYDNAKSMYKDFLINNTKASFIAMKGDILRPRFLNLYGYFGTVLNPEISGQWATENSKTASDKQLFAAYMRIIVCKLKKSTQLVPSKITQGPDQVISNSNFYDVKPIYGPLKDNITSNMTVIKNKVIKITNSNPSKLYKIRLSAKKLGYIYRKSADGVAGGAYTSGENEIVVYIQYVCPNLLRYQNTGGVNVNVGPSVRFTMSYDFGCVDQN